MEQKRFSATTTSAPPEEPFVGTLLDAGAGGPTYYTKEIEELKQLVWVLCRRNPSRH